MVSCKMLNESSTNWQKEKKEPCVPPGARTVSPGGPLHLSFFLLLAHNSIKPQSGHKCFSNGISLQETLWMYACEGRGERNIFKTVM